MSKCKCVELQEEVKRLRKVVQATENYIRLPVVALYWELEKAVIEFVKTDSQKEKKE